MENKWSQLILYYVSKLFLLPVGIAPFTVQKETLKRDTLNSWVAMYVVYQFHKLIGIWFAR